MVVLDLWGIARRRWPLVVVSVLAAIGLAAIYVIRTPTIYESTAEVLVIQKDSSLPAEGVDGKLGFDQRDSTDLLATHMHIIASPSIVSAALQKPQHQYRDRFQQQFELLESGEPPASRDSPDDETQGSTDPLATLPSIVERLGEDQDPVDYVLDNLAIHRGGEGAAKDAHVLHIEFHHTCEVDSAAVLDAIVDSYKEFLAETVQGAGGDAAELIETLTVNLSNNMDQTDRDYREFRQEAPLLWSQGESQNVHQLRVAAWESHLSELSLRITATKSRLEIVRESLAPDSAAEYSDLERFALIDNGDIDRLALMLEVQKGDPQSQFFLARQPERAGAATAEYSQLLLLRAEATRLALQFGPNHNRLEEVQQQIADIEALLEQKKAALGGFEEEDPLDLMLLVKAYEILLEHDVHSMEQQKLEFQRLIDGERASARSMIDFELREESLSGARTRAQELYDASLARLREMNLLKDYGGFITAILSPVELGEASWPKIPLIGALALLLGGLSGCGLALAVDLADNSFRGPEDIKDNLQLPILAYLSPLSSCEVEDSPLHPTLVAFHEPKSAAAENIRRLRTSLTFHSVGQNGTVIQTTSPLQGDGKTTTTANVAVSLALAGKRVLAIDADMRRPYLHKQFGIENANGLSDVLVGRIDLDSAMVTTEIENLSIVPSGTIPPNPSELLATPRFAELIESLRTQFDFVFLDTPPLLSVIDPLIVSPHADGVVMVLRLQRDSRSVSLRAKEALEDSDATLLGLVVNGAGSESQSYLYGNGYRDKFGGYEYNDDDYCSDSPQSLSKT